MRCSRAQADSVSRIHMRAFLCAYPVGVILEPDLFTDAIDIYIGKLSAVPAEPVFLSLP